MQPFAGALSGQRAEARPRPQGRILVVVPAKDEEESLPAVLAELADLHPAADTLVVDDGSKDDTALCARRALCRVVSHPFNLGYGASLLTGYHFALRHDYTHVVQLDADGQHPPGRIPDLLAPILDERADVVVGSRYLEGRGREHGWLRRAAARPIAWLASKWTGRRITDPTSGFQAISPRALRVLCSDGFPEDFPDVDVLIGLDRGGLRVTEIPVKMRARRGGTSMHGGVRALYYFYRLAVCLLLLPVRRSSPYRSQRR